jgi:hypothetical protein
VREEGRVMGGMAVVEMVVVEPGCAGGGARGSRHRIGRWINADGGGSAIRV